jgi:hypothetical protein
MKLSLIHATRRPEAAKACQKLWLDNADNVANIEIITCVDHDDEAGKAAFPDAVISRENTVVAAWNEAAKHATGDILIGLDDDWVSPPSWDQIIESYMCNGADILHVGDLHRKDDLVCHAIISKRFYDAMGYLYHPSFKSVYCDNWFSEVAKRWGYVDATQGGKVDLGFIHKNPSQGYGTEDEVARKSNSKERYEHGKAVFERLQNQTILAFTVAGRRDYLRQSLQSWLDTDLRLVTAVHFFIEPINVDEINMVIDAFAVRCPVPVIRHFNKEKMGVLRNPWHLFDNCFRIEGAKYVILGEDDFLVSPDVLNFFEQSKGEWVGDEWIGTTMATCAKWVGKDADNNPAGWHRTSEFTGNIWMTDAGSWTQFLRGTWDSDYSSGKADESPSGWDWHLQLRVMPKNNLHCIVPTASRSKHIGISGVHCTEEVFDDTVAWNFVDKPYAGPYTNINELKRAPKLSSKTYSGVVSVTSSGDIGDCVVSLAALHHKGCEAVYLLRDNSQTKGITSKINIINPLLMSQPYIRDVRIYNGENVDWASEGFRSGWVQNDHTLAGNHAKHALDKGFIASLPDLSQPWLFGIKPSAETKGKVVINRSPRYNNPYFQWKKVVEFYGDDLVFLGLEHEHRAFCDAYGHVKFRPTVNMLEVAELIAGSELLIANQSSCMTIAEGLKHPRIQEGCLHIADCVYPNAENAQYVFDGSMILPAINGRSILSVESTVKNWRNYILNEVPNCGRGRYGWYYQHNDVMICEGAFEFAWKKVRKLTQWDDEVCQKAVVDFTVALNPQWFERKVKLPQLDVARRALRNAGYTQHPIL